MPRQFNARWCRLLRSSVLATARWQQPGQLSRLDAIQCAIDVLDARRYLEIGIDDGTVFTDVVVERKFGVDPAAPAPPVARITGEPGVSYHQMESDEFFARVAAAQTGFGIDVAFIDGLHTWTQAHRDCLNALGYLAPGGVIVMHDCLPASAQEACVADNIADAWRRNGPDWNGDWTGDVWKAIVLLRATEPGLQADVLNSDHGIGIVRRGRNNADLGLDREAVERMDFADLQRDHVRLLGLREPSYLWHVLNGLRDERLTAAPAGAAHV